MLILRRSVNEEIVVTSPGGDRIRIMICSIRRNGRNAQVGVDAPIGYTIDRAELLEES